MKTDVKIPAFICAALIIFGCDSALFYGGTRQSPSARAAEVVVEAPAPQFVEEGTTYNGTVVVAPASISDYVFINGGWYYWHPGLNIWVHAAHDRDWHPGASVHVYSHWSDHPQYRRR